MASLEKTKKHLNSRVREVLADRHIDESGIAAVITLSNSKIFSWIKNSLPKEVTGQRTLGDCDAIGALEFIWQSIHNEIVRYFHLQFILLKREQLRQWNDSKTNNSYLPMKKVNEKFLKFNGKIQTFYYSLARHLLGSFNVAKFISPKISKLYETEPDRDKEPLNSTYASIIIYLLHKLTYYQGKMSRWRTLFSLYVCSSTTAALKLKTHRSIRFSTFNKSITFYEASISLLPSFSDPFVSIGIINEYYGGLSKTTLTSVLDGFNSDEETTVYYCGDKFTAVYYYIRAAAQRLSGDLQFTELSSILCHESKAPSKFYSYFLKIYNCAIFKTSRSDIDGMKSLFILLLSWYHFPQRSVLKEILRNRDGSFSLEKRLRQVKHCFFQDLHLLVIGNVVELKRIIVMAIGGFYISIKGKENYTYAKLPASSKRYLEFVFEVLTEYMSILHREAREGVDSEEYKKQLAKALPSVRIFSGWLINDEIALDYARHNVLFMVKYAYFLNTLYKRFTSDFFNHRQVRARYFQEDVELKEFRPIGNFFKDFKDGMLNKSKYSDLRLNGEYPLDSITKKDIEWGDKNIMQDETLLRIYAVGWLGKKIVADNNVNIKFSTENNGFNLNEYFDEILVSKYELFSEPAQEEEPRNEIRKKYEKSQFRETDFEDEKKNVQTKDSNTALRNRLQQANGKVLMKETGTKAISRDASSKLKTSSSRKLFKKPSCKEEVLVSEFEKKFVSNDFWELAVRVKSDPEHEQDAVVGASHMIEQKVTLNESVYHVADDDKDTMYHSMVNSLLDDDSSTFAPIQFDSFGPSAPICSETAMPLINTNNIWSNKLASVVPAVVKTNLSDFSSDALVKIQPVKQPVTGSIVSTTNISSYEKLYNMNISDDKIIGPVTGSIYLDLGGCTNPANLMPTKNLSK